MSDDLENKKKIISNTDRLQFVLDSKASQHDINKAHKNEYKRKSKNSSIIDIGRLLQIGKRGVSCDG